MAVKVLTQSDVGKKQYGNDVYVELGANQAVVIRLLSHLDKFDPLDLTTRVRYEVNKVWKGGPFSENWKPWGLEFPVLDFKDEANAHLDPMTYIKANDPNAFKNSKGEAIKITSGYMWLVAVQATAVFNVPNKFAPWDVNKFDFLPEPKVLKLTEQNYAQLEAWYQTEVLNGNDPLLTPIMYSKTGKGGKGSKWDYDFKAFNGGPANKALPPVSQKDAIKVVEVVPYSTFASQVKVLEKIGYILPYADPDGSVEEESEWGSEEE